MSPRLRRLARFGYLFSWIVLTLGTGPLPAATAETQPENPYYREALFYRQQAQPLLALAALQAARQQDLLETERSAVDLLLGELYRDYGLPGQAADNLQRASGARVGSLRGQAWWALAMQRYERGDYARADAALKRTTGLLPYELEQQRPLLQAQILIAMNRNAEAAELLNAWQPIQDQDPYTRYNAGVALVRDGKLLAGAGMLDSVGTMPAPDSELQALRDQANLAMGYGFLRADHGATARPLFKRVRLDGPYSSLALLGAGWAELAPDGTRQQNLYLSPVGCVEDPARVLPESLLILRRPPRAACDRERTFKSRVYFEQVPGAETEAERYRRALIPWLTLIRRHPADPAVQEALLAVPFAYSRIKVGEQAIDHYRSAIDHYESERRQLQRTAQLIREASLPFTPAQASDKRLPAWDLPRVEDALYLGPLFASHPFQSALKDLQALRTLTRSLTPLGERLDRVQSRFQSHEPVAETTGETGPEATGQDTEPDTPADPDPETARDTRESEPPGDADTERRITYFGVFDFLPPPAATVNAPPPAGDSPATTAPGEESPAAVLQRRKNRSNDEEPPRQQHERLRVRLDLLQAQIRVAEDDYENELRELALTEITQQQLRLDTYLAQARFSLARLLDPPVASHRGD